MAAAHHQIVENFVRDHVHLHGIDYNVAELCSGVLSTGATGSGKTTSIVNPLAAALARLHLDDADLRPAVVYLNSKGDGARHFLSLVPAARRNDLVCVNGANRNSLLLFDRNCWPNRTELAEATFEFLLEAARHSVGTADRLGGHKVYFESIRNRPIRFAAQAEVAEADGGSEKHGWFCPRSHLLAVVRRLREFIALIEQPATASPATMVSGAARAVAEVITAHGLSYEELDAFVTSAKAALQPGTAKERAVLHLARQLLDEALESIGKRQPTAANHAVRGLQSILSSGSARELAQLVDASRRSHQESRYSLTGELASLCDLIDCGAVSKMLAASGGSGVGTSFEEVIDQGKILIVDLPVADSGGSTRFALALLSLHFQQVSLRRRSARIAGRAINCRRPVVFVADEFPSYLCSAGRYDGLEQWLSRSREFGVIPILATQNLNLLTEAFASTTRTSAFLANVRTRFFSANACAETNQWASWCCGRDTERTVSAVVNWWDDPALDTALAQGAKTLRAVLPPGSLGLLETGEYVVQTCGGVVARVNANRRHAAPDITPLNRAGRRSDGSGSRQAHREELSS
ncbi:MAG: type IV secretory system conjugative DNA transfer family protein [Opitutaceae bacterium]|nr:type IV secretory system conjugative DNA transfer family protein [Opitutaceae bacterium]